MWDGLAFSISCGVLSSDNMGFPNLLKQLREKAGLSQAGLAKKSGLSVRSIQNWEQGHRGPSAQGIIALAQGLKVSAEVLLHALRKRKAK